MKTVQELVLIEAKAKVYSDSRQVLSERVDALQEEIRAITRRRLPGIKSAMAQAKDAQNDLSNAVQAVPQCFVQPRTVTLHGIKVGYRKGNGTIEWKDDERVVELIRKHLPDQAEVLVQTVEVPIKKALQNLSVADLRRIGCTVEEAGDHVYIKASDTDLDKIVAGILKEGSIDEEEGT